MTGLKSRPLLRKLASALAVHTPLSQPARLVLGAAIFIIALTARSLHAVDTADVMYTAEQPLNSLTYTYDLRATAILDGEGILGPYDVDPANTFWLARAPGYSIFMAVVYSSLGRDFFKVQFVQNVLNSASSVLIFLITGRLIGWRCGTTAGMLTALSHNLCQISNLILPDSLSALPVLLAFYLLTSTRTHTFSTSSNWRVASASVLIGVSAWLRSQMLLVGPFLALVIATGALGQRVRARPGILITALSLMTIAPMTIRNYLVYGEFVPINIGLGMVLWVGIGEAGGVKFGAVTSDGDVAAQEAAIYQNPEYLQSWSTPDGIKRDRDRVKRSLGVIVRHPIWFAGSVLKRIERMFRYARHGELVGHNSSQVSDGSGTGDLSRRAWPTWYDILPDRSFLAYGNNIHWTRLLLRTLQQVIKQSIPAFLFIGAIILFWVSWRRAVLISIVPFYFLIFQSPMHTESRYTAAMQYFLFIFAAVTWVVIVALCWNAVHRLILIRKRRLA